MKHGREYITHVIPQNVVVGYVCFDVTFIKFSRNPYGSCIFLLSDLFTTYPLSPSIAKRQEMFLLLNRRI